MGDRIEVTGIRAWGHHGVLDHERELGQEFIIDLVVEADLTAAGRSDDLTDTIDYGTLAARTVELVAGQPCRLIERLAERIATMVREQDLVTGVTVTVRKPSAPFTVPVDEAAVTITR